jgi:tryptophan halogenase
VEPQPANAFKLSLEADDVVIEFGNTAQPEETGGAAAVAVNDRVTLPVESGRRLLYWLNQCVERHAASQRAEQAKNLSPEQAALTTRPGQTPARPPPDEAGERGAELLRLVGGLGIPYQYERSFRICDHALLANRFLLTVDPGNIPNEPCRRILEICNRMRVPQAAREAAEANFGMAKCVHFGFEADDGGIICKLYLERAISPDEAARARADRAPVLLHLAFKWDLLRDAAITTRYWWHPGLSLARIEERLAYVYRDGPQTSFEIARAAVALTTDRAAPESLQYLEVEEVENARRSFDLNLYNAKLQVKDMQHLLYRMREHFGVRPGQLQALYDQIKLKALGHLAGGVHRRGEDFFNVYYGVIGLPHFNRELR